MRYAQIRPFDVANGDGIRVSIFVTGCTHRCFNCFNEEYQSFEFGAVWGEEETQRVIAYLKNPAVSGLTLLGGEPMQNVELAEIVQTIRQEVDKSVWVYSGYTYEQIVSHPGRKKLLDVCDVLVDGLYVEELRDLKLRFRGSANQRIIDLSASRAAGAAVTLQYE